MMAQTQVVKKQKMGKNPLSTSKSNCYLRQIDITGTCLNNLRSEESCDVVIICQDEKFSAHKLILRAGSAYFNAMFSSGLKEATSSEVSLPTVSARSMAIILDCLYLQNLTIHDLTVEETLDLLSAAHLLQVSPIVETCIEELSKMITDDNWDIVLQDAAKYSIECLVSAVVQYLQRCDNWFKNEKSHKLGFDSFYALIADLYKHNYYSADILINLIVSWAAHERTDLEKHLLALFSLIDFTSASKDAVNNLVNNDSLIKNSLELSNLILKKIVPSVNNSLTPKIESSYSKLLVFRSNSVHSYDFLKGDWFVHNLSPDLFPDTCSRMAVSDSAVYFIAEVFNDDGHRRNYVMKIMSFFPATNSTTVITTCKKRRNFGIVYFNDILYFTGGFMYSGSSNRGFQSKDNYLESFCLKSQTWKSLANPIQYRNNPQIVCASGALFVFGGFNEGNLIRTVEKYCPIGDQWTVFSDIPGYISEISILSVVPCYSKIYIFSKDGHGTHKSKFMEFEPESNTWRELTEYKNSSNNWTLHDSAKSLPFLVIEQGGNYYKIDPRTNNKMLITQAIQNGIEKVKLVIFA